MNKHQNSSKEFEQTLNVNIFNRCRTGWWWIQTKDAGIVPDYCFNGSFSENTEILQVLEPCDYTNFVRLIKEVKQQNELLKECQKYFEYMTNQEIPLDSSMDFMDEKLLTKLNEVLK